MKYLSSNKNPEIKQLKLLSQKSRERKKRGLFVVEGKRELEKAISGNYLINSIFIEENHELDCENIVQKLSNADQFIVSNSVFEQISFRSGSEKIIGIAQSKKHDLKNFKLKKNALILVLEAPEKPGNIGALLRTADAAHVDAVIIANPRTDLYNSNVIRSSVGGLFTVSIAVATSEETIGFLNERRIPIYSAVLQESVPYVDINLSDASALVVGSESTGLSEIWRSSATKTVQIPMLGDLDSMNVSVAAGILLFEAIRQRNFLT